MNKQEREKLRELAEIAVNAVKHGNGMQISEAYAKLQNEIYADKLIALLDHIDALEGQVEAAERAIGDHFVPDHCYATGPLTGDPIKDFIECPACIFLAMRKAAIACATEVK